MKQLTDLVNHELPLTLRGVPVYLDESGTVAQAGIVISPDVLDRMEKRQASWTQFLGSLTAADIERICRTGP